MADHLYILEKVKDLSLIPVEHPFLARKTLNMLNYISKIKSFVFHTEFYKRNDM